MLGEHLPDLKLFDFVLVVYSLDAFIQNEPSLESVVSSDPFFSVLALLLQVLDVLGLDVPAAERGFHFPLDDVS